MYTVDDKYLGGGAGRKEREEGKPDKTPPWEGMLVFQVGGWGDD